MSASWKVTPPPRLGAHLGDSGGGKKNLLEGQKAGVIKRNQDPEQTPPPQPAGLEGWVKYVKKDKQKLGRRRIAGEKGPMAKGQEGRSWRRRGSEHAWR